MTEIERAAGAFACARAHKIPQRLVLEQVDDVLCELPPIAFRCEKTGDAVRDRLRDSAARETYYGSAKRLRFDEDHAETFGVARACYEAWNAKNARAIHPRANCGRRLGSEKRKIEER